jgi:uncharacterized protein YecE (DUF72 family)
MENILSFGTAGWSYPDWNGTVYPQKKAKDFNHLEFLGQHFDFIEVNTSFYRIPSSKLTEGWVKKTESMPDFKFWVKLYQQFTHKRTVDQDDVKSFKKALEPLKEAGKLAGILIQFPYSFHLNKGYLNYLVALTDLFKEYTQAIEMRHKSWDRRELIEVLKEKNLIWVNIDQPTVSQSLPLTAHMTHKEISYFRLHGRNEKSWFANKGRDARYDYDYNALELEDIGKKVKELKKMAKQIFISGNNHYKGSAVKNLIELQKLMMT